MSRHGPSVEYMQPTYLESKFFKQWGEWKPYNSHGTVLAHSTEVVHCAIPLNNNEYNVMQNMHLWNVMHYWILMQTNQFCHIVIIH